MNVSGDTVGIRLAKVQRRLIAALVFFVVLAIFPFTPDPAGDIKTLAYEVGAFVLLALWLFSPRDPAEPARRSPGFFSLVAVFLGLNLVAGLLSVNIGYSLFRESVRWTALAILFAVAADVFRTPKQVWGLVGVFCAAVAVSSLYGVAQFLGMDPFPWNDETGMLREAPSTYGNPNFASHALAPAIILALGLATQRRGRWALLCLPFFLAHFALTQTRGSLLALAGATVLVLVGLPVGRRIKSASRGVAVTLAAVLLICVVGIAAVAAVTEFKTGRPYPYDSSDSITLRYHSFYGACRMILDKPWLGYGPGMYQVANPPYWTPLEQERFTRRNMLNDHVHNEPLEIAVDAGLPAAIAYVALLLLGLYHGLRLGLAGGPGRRALGFALAAFFFAFLLDGLFGFNVHAPVSALLLFVFAGATAGVGGRDTTASRAHVGPTGRLAVAWRLAALVCAAAIPVLGLRDFSARLFLQRGYGAEKAGAEAAAADSFRKSAALAPYDWLPAFCLGTAAMHLDRPDEAASCFVRTLELHPNFVQARLMSAKALLNIAAKSPGNAATPALQEAVEQAKDVIELCPPFPESYDILGRAGILYAQQLAASGGAETSEAKQTWADAEQHLLRGVALGSAEPAKLYRLAAVARLALGDGFGAQKALVRSLEEEPAGTETWPLFLQASRQTGQYDAIRARLDRRIRALDEEQAAPRDELCTLRLLRAQVLYNGYGDASGAEADFRQAVALGPARVDAWAAFHAFVKSTDRQEVFRSSLKQAAAGAQGDGLSPEVRAAALGLGQDETGVVAGVSTLVDALQRHQAAVPDGTGTAGRFSWAADVLAGEAERTPLSPDNAGNVYFQLALVYGACQDFDAAVRLLDRAVPHLTGAERLQGLLRKAAALARTGKTAAAVEACEQAVAGDPASLEARYALARSLAQDGQRNRARLEYEAILAGFDLNEEGRKTLQRELEALTE